MIEVNRIEANDKGLKSVECMVDRIQLSVVQIYHVIDKCLFYLKNEYKFIKFLVRFENLSIRAKIVVPELLKN